MLDNNKVRQLEEKRKENIQNTLSNTFHRVLNKFN